VKFDPLGSANEFNDSVRHGAFLNVLAAHRCRLGTECQTTAGAVAHGKKRTRLRSGPASCGSGMLVNVLFLGVMDADDGLDHPLSVAD
jgi:hypothetical protein